MPKKFILIDQSIVNIAGHYYEYAMHVLEAAQRAGYEPYLATHKRFAAHSRHSPWRTHTAYRYGFWAAKDTGGGGLLGRIFGILGWMRFQWRLFYQYSLFGLLWAVRDRFGEFLLKQRLDRTQLASLATLVPAAVFLKLLRFTGLLLLFPFVLVVFLWRSLVRILAAGGFPRAYVRSLLADAADLWRFLLAVFHQRNVYRRWYRDYRALQSFRKDSGKLLRDLEVGPGDIIFIPTLSAIEFIGLSELLKRTAPGPSWHLLFRRDIYPGRESGYAQQEWQVSGLRASFATAQPKLKGHDVRYYTDTDELTAQYNRLGQYPFRTAPIPHTHPPAPAARSADGPLRVIYVGDARREKGYQYIPRLVEDLWSGYIVTGRVSFCLQSNFNIPLGEPEVVIARQQLDLLAKRAPEAIELLKQPLTSEQYKDLLLSGDINLVLYDRDNYYARSSGILVESLSAGIPVIAPANTWLSRQFAGAQAVWRLEAAGRMTELRRITLAHLRWQTLDRRRNPVAGGVLTMREGSKAFASVRVPTSASYLLIKMTLSAGREVVVEVANLDVKGNPIGYRPPKLLETLDEGRIVDLQRLNPDTAQLRLAITAGEAEAVSVSALELVFLNSPYDVPLSAVSLSYHDLPEIPSLLREAVDHHEHYRATARDFAVDWRRFHNADRLVAELGGNR
ncbi:MAG: hypothetical protein SGI92_10375 [Bryobacteraceae bacterium]|nr:hypothetical protein [Bryobacteraceae bacterium]